jgi:hypothetical protein
VGFRHKTQEFHTGNSCMYDLTPKTRSLGINLKEIWPAIFFLISDFFFFLVAREFDLRVLCLLVGAPLLEPLHQPFIFLLEKICKLI